jgi:hypothetical protein
MPEIRINRSKNRFTIDVVIGCAEFLAMIEIVSEIFFREINNYCKEFSFCSMVFALNIIYCFPISIIFFETSLLQALLAKIPRGLLKQWQVLC